MNDSTFLNKTYGHLTKQEETAFVLAWQKSRDREAVRILVTSHLRFIAKIAKSYFNGSVPMEDLIAEGCVGFMIALDKFDPNRGVRLSSYSRYWVKAVVWMFFYKNQSAVVFKGNPQTKFVFLNLWRTKIKLGLYKNLLSFNDIQKVARALGVSEADVVEISGRISGDYSLNATLKRDGKDSHQDFLVSEGPNPEEEYIKKQEFQKRHAWVMQSLGCLTPREQEIFSERHLLDNPTTLKILSQRHGISRERVCQIGWMALKKVKKEVLALANGEGETE